MLKVSEDRQAVEKMTSRNSVYQAIRELQKETALNRKETASNRKETASNRKRILEHDKRFERIEKMLKKK